MAPSWREEQLLSWATARRSMPGQQRSGDDALVRVTRRGLLVGVVDALGHGDEAAEAAALALATLDRRLGESVIALIRHCHRALQGSRGVVMSLALFDATEGTMTWLAVGNVAAVLLQPDHGGDPAALSLVSRGGIVGLHLPPLRAEVVSIAPGDHLILATDGVRQDFADALSLAGSPQEIADRILAQHGKESDDALVLAARSLIGSAS